MQIPHQYKFLIKLGKALHTYGVPSYKSQRYLSEIANLKGIKGSFMDTPTWINYVFYEEDENSYNYVECVPPGDINLGGLSRVVEITKKVLADELSFKDAQNQIDQLNTEPSGYSKIIELISFMFLAGSFSIILDTNWASVFAASFIGSLVYGLTLLARKSSYIRSTLESLAAFMATFITGILSLYIKEINISLTILASIIVFIPGLAITSALEEITSKSLVSGTAKLFDALISLFKQFFGVVMGLAILPLIIELNQDPMVNDIPKWVDYPAILILATSLLPIFKVRTKDIPLAALTGFISFTVTVLLDFTGILVSIFIGTIVTTGISKLFSQLTLSPRLVFLIPGIIMLVPGSKAFIGLSTFYLNNTISNTTNMGEQVLYIFMGIIGGLIFSGSFMDGNLTNTKGSVNS